MTSETADSNPDQIALDESQEILDRITDAFFALDGQWRFTFVNERAEDLLDQPRDALLGQTIWSTFPATADSEFEREFQRALETQEPSTFEANYAPLGRWFEVRVYPSESGLSVYFRDVTDQKERERELERYETIVETVDDGVYVLDSEARFVLVNDAYCEFTGYDREESLGSSAALVVDEETRAAAGQLEAELMAGERQRASLEAELQTADGKTVPAEATFAMFPGEGRRRVGVVRDVSDKRRRERRLTEQRDQLEQLVDVNAVVQRVNRAIVGAETRAEIEETVCEHLVDATEYEVAWIGELDATGERVRPRVGAGVDDATLAELAAAEGSAPRPGPVTNALRRGNVYVIQNVVEDPDDPRGEVFDEQGYYSSISLPLAHEDDDYGVLTIDSSRRHAYSGTERELLEALADTVGYALHTVEERGRYRSVIDEALDTAADVGVFITDADGDLAWTNRAAESYFGVDEAAVLDRERQEVLNHEIAPAVADPSGVRGQARSPEETGTVEYRVETDGKRAERWVEHRSQPIETGLYAGGRVDLFYDVTERKQSKAALHESERRRETLISNLPGMAYHSRNEAGWPMEFASEGCEELTGYTPAELTGEVDWTADVVHPADREERWQTVADALEPDGDATFEVTYRIVRKDGTTCMVWEGGSGVYEDGELVAVEGIVTDETERQQAVEELRRERDITDQVLETSPVGIVVATPDGTITRANDRAHELLGLKVDATGAPYTPGKWTVYDEEGERIPPEGRLISRALRTGEPVERDIEIELDGGNIWLSARAVPVTTDGEIERVVATAQDITELKERERQLRAQRDELERLDHVNGIIRSTLESVVAARGLTEMEVEVCAELVERGPYQAAWFGDLDLATSDVTPTTTAGDEAETVQRYLAAREAATEPGPVETAIRTGEIQTVADVTTDPWFDSGRETAPDYRSVAVVPIRYEDSQYGVLVIHAEQPGAFDDEVAAVLAELGDAIGLARNAIIRREGLLSDNVTRIELRLRDTLPLAVEADGDAVEIEQAVSVGDGTLLLYLAVEGIPPDVVESATEETEELGQLRLISEEDDRYRYELEVADPPLTETLVTHGGRLRSVDIDGRDYHVVAELPPQVDVRTVFGAVQERYPDAELDAQRSVSRRESSAEYREGAFDRLTDRQQEALETAHAAGYFDWPRDSSGEEVADTLGVSPSTFHQHLRVGERKILKLLFDAD